MRPRHDPSPTHLRASKNDRMNDGSCDPLHVDAQRVEEILCPSLIRMIPEHVLPECRQEARRAIKERPTSRVAIAAIVAIFFAGRVIL